VKYILEWSLHILPPQFLVQEQHFTSVVPDVLPALTHFDTIMQYAMTEHYSETNEIGRKGTILCYKLHSSEVGLWPGMFVGDGSL